MKTDINNDLGGRFLAEYDARGEDTIHLGEEIKPLVAEYGRDGVDLTLTSDNGDFVTIHDYFASFPGADLITAGGARIPSDIVSKLAGPGPLEPGAEAQHRVSGSARLVSWRRGRQRPCEHLGKPDRRQEDRRR